MQAQQKAKGCLLVSELRLMIDYEIQTLHKVEDSKDNRVGCCHSKYLLGSDKPHHFLRFWIRNHWRRKQISFTKRDLPCHNWTILLSSGFPD